VDNLTHFRKQPGKTNPKKRIVVLSKHLATRRISFRWPYIVRRRPTAWTGLLTQCATVRFRFIRISRVVPRSVRLGISQRSAKPIHLAVNHATRSRPELATKWLDELKPDVTPEALDKNGIVTRPQTHEAQNIFVSSCLCGEKSAGRSRRRPRTSNTPPPGRRCPSRHPSMPSGVQGNDSQENTHAASPRNATRNFPATAAARPRGSPARGSHAIPWHSAGSRSAQRTPRTHRREPGSRKTLTRQ
jgi:hypothetical protein